MMKMMDSKPDPALLYHLYRTKDITAARAARNRWLLISSLLCLYPFVRPVWYSFADPDVLADEVANWFPEDVVVRVESVRGRLMATPNKRIPFHIVGLFKFIHRPPRPMDWSQLCREERVVLLMFDVGFVNCGAHWAMEWTNEKPLKVVEALFVEIPTPPDEKAWAPEMKPRKEVDWNYVGFHTWEGTIGIPFTLSRERLRRIVLDVLEDSSGVAKYAILIISMLWFLLDYFVFLVQCIICSRIAVFLFYHIFGRFLRSRLAQSKEALAVFACQGSGLFRFWMAVLVFIHHVFSQFGHSALSSLLAGKFSPFFFLIWEVSGLLGHLRWCCLAIEAHVESMRRKKNPVLKSKARRQRVGPTPATQRESPNRPQDEVARNLQCQMMIQQHLFLQHQSRNLECEKMQIPIPSGLIPNIDNIDSEALEYIIESACSRRQSPNEIYKALAMPGLPEDTTRELDRTVRVAYEQLYRGNPLKRPATGGHIGSDAICAAGTATKPNDGITDKITATATEQSGSSTHPSSVPHRAPPPDVVSQPKSVSPQPPPPTYSRPTTPTDAPSVARLGEEILSDSEVDAGDNEPVYLKKKPISSTG